jgi:CshA-type fibril repeat protein
VDRAGRGELRRCPGGRRGRRRCQRSRQRERWWGRRRGDLPVDEQHDHPDPVHPADRPDQRGGAGAGGTGGLGTSLQGHNGGAAAGGAAQGGGGGGAGTAGTSSDYGLGLSVSITGSAVTYASGGPAPAYSLCVAGAATTRSPIRGAGCLSARRRFTAGALPVVPGGGGASANGTAPSPAGYTAGQAGIVIVRYLTPPGAPGTPSAVVTSDTSATVSFAVPAGGPTPSSYRVEVVGDSTRSCIYTSILVARLRSATLAPSCVVSGRTAGTAYTFRVKATLSGVDSDWAGPSNQITTSGSVTAAPGAPSPPNAPTGMTAGTASVTAAWAPVPGATGYTVTAQPGPSACTTTAATSCVLGAVAGTAYTVTVFVRSEAGSSVPSAPSNAVTPLDPVIPPTAPSSAPTTLTTDKGKIALATPGQQITVIGSGFAGNSTATVILYSTPIPLGTVTTDGSGGFAAPVTVPADLPAGQHTFLASGVDPAGAPRAMALPVTVAPTDSGSSGGGTNTQTGALPVPAGGTITLLDAAGLPATTVTVTQGTYALDSVTGIISFVPVTGFVGTAASVAYRITDAIGTVVNGTYTAVVTAPAPPSPPAGRLTVTLPARIVSSTGKHGSVPASCRISRGAIARCTITVTAVVSKRTVVVARGTKSTTAGQSLKRVTVRAALTPLGRSLAARPGGTRFVFTAVAVQRGRTGSGTARGASRVLARTIALPRAVYFRTASASVGKAGASYLRSMRGSWPEPR